MWKLAPTIRIEGENGSLRFAMRLVRNLALTEARRLKRVTPVDLSRLESLPDFRVDPEPASDPGLRRLIEKCLERLPPRPREALLARLRGQGRSSDRDLAVEVRMQPNTFLVNIVRARRLLADCLRQHGVTEAGA